MILSRGRRYVFLHAPKTGGTALSLALEARAMKDDILIGDTPKARARRGRLAGLKTGGRLWKHSTLADIQALLTEDELRSFFLFTLVRNPWDRAVSYYHWLRAQGFTNPAVTLAKRLDFAGFISEPDTRAAFRLWPAGAYLRDASGMERPATYLRLEHLAQDAAPLEAHLGFALGPVARVNTSDRAADYRVYYTGETAAFVAQDCAEDITRFGYRFDP